MDKGLYLNMFYRDHIFPSNAVETEVIWSDGHSSEFKNQYKRLLIQEFSNKYKKTLIWKFSATTHGKGVANGTGGKAKSSVRKKVMSLVKDQPIVQDAESFSKLAHELPQSTIIIHVSPEVNTNRHSNIFSKSVPVHSILKMYDVMADTKNSYLWSILGTQKVGSKSKIQIPNPQIQARNPAFNQGNVQIKKPLSCNDVVKVDEGNLLGYYAIITELEELGKVNDDDDEVETNYLQKSFGKCVLLKNNLDSRMICQLQYVNAAIDS